MADDPYMLLGVARDATPAAIKQAYRKRARQHHPDLNPGKPEAEARFKAINAAHDLLADPERRARFDRGEIDAAGEEQAPAGGYRRHAESPQGERYGAAGPDAGMFEDLFADLFAARRAAEAGPRPGPDIAYRLEVPFTSAVTGATERLTLAEGRVLDVKIPPGVVSGQVLRLRGRGGPGRQGGPAGDALIELMVADHPALRRDGQDLRLDLPVTLREAVLGGAVVVPAPGGAVRVTLPAGSDAGRTIRLRGKGIAAHGGTAAGDLYLTLRVVIGPPDAALEAFLRDWVPEHPVDPRAGLEASA
jgi:DnaJ-class molecular chaperone